MGLKPVAMKKTIFLNYLKSDFPVSKLYDLFN
jgi:hypothetical protein